MSEILRQYPLVLRAFNEVRAGYESETVVDHTGIVRRTAEILKNTLPPAGRETVMVAGVLFCRASGLFSKPPSADAFDAYGPDVAGLMLDIRLNPNRPPMDSYIDKRILQIYTAHQVARDETSLRGKGPASLDHAYVMLGDLRQRRLEKDTGVWRDIGAPRLQALEIETHRKLSRVIESWIRYNDKTATPARAGMYSPN